MADPIHGRASRTRILSKSGVRRNYPTPVPVDYNLEPYSKHRDSESNIEHEVPVDDEDFIGLGRGETYKRSDVGTE